MPRTTTILISILMGALASGIGIGLFLHQANTDRLRLAEKIDTANKNITEIRESNRKTIEETNQKLREANTEIAKAQQLIKNMDDERRLQATAQALRVPSAKTMLGWNDVIDLELGVSLKQPPNSLVATNGSRALTLIQNTPQTNGDPRWFTIKPYSQQEEQELIQTLSTSTAITYTVDGNVLTGVRGEDRLSRQQTLILRIQQSGIIRYILWAKDPNGNSAITPTVMNALASLRFKT